MQSDTSDTEPSSFDPALRRARLWSYFTRYKGWFAGGAVFLLVTNVLSFAIPAYLGEAIELMRSAWVDDEIELLRPHLLFLEQRGYSVDPVSNGDDALAMLRGSPY
ncbi:MAG: hypothetical protein ACNA8W_26010, partial [Bradymonadaceae bacterium]